MHSSIHIVANHAPLWVFVLLGGILGVIAVVLYFATGVGGGDKDYLYGDPTRQHYLPYPTGGAYGPFGGGGWRNGFGL